MALVPIKNMETTWDYLMHHLSPEAVAKRVRAYRVRDWITLNRIETHEQGIIVLAPPGSGKSTFVRSHEQWVDVDEFLGRYLNFHTERWHSVRRTEKEIEEHYRECDRYLDAMRNAGLWVVGSLFWDYIPDSIVIIPERKHADYVKHRDDLDWEAAKKVRIFLEKMARKKSIPVFNNWDALVQAHATTHKPQSSQS